MNPYIKRFDDISMKDLPLVGGKNASLGEMMTQLASEGIRVPDGFATTTAAFGAFLDHNKLGEPLKSLMSQLERPGYSNLETLSAQARDLIIKAIFPESLAGQIRMAYQDLSGDEPIGVAVRSSATIEDSPQASFAGQHESYLNVCGSNEIIRDVQKCYASLYTARAVKYREDNGFSHADMALSVGIQRMVRSDKACSGVGFTLEPESGFRDIIHISGVWGLGENIVQGAVTPDEFFVFKPSLLQNKRAIVLKKLGDKGQMMVYPPDPNSSLRVINLETPAEKRNQYVLSDQEVMQLARWAHLIELHYQKPMDIEWAKDGRSGELFIVQARPETVHSQKNPYLLTEYRLHDRGEVLAEGEAIGEKIISGVARHIASPDQEDQLAAGDILVTDTTTPDWDPILKRVSAIITNKGGRTSHASIVARELGVPAIVGAAGATEMIRDGEQVTVSCCEGKTGYVYRGKLHWEEIEHDFTRTRLPEATEAKLILGDPEKAFNLSFFPNDGIGLMRIEFIIMHFIQIHPMALIGFAGLKDPGVRERIDELTHQAPDKEGYFIERLSEGIATIACAFFPKEVILRFSDFKSNEYANLIGGREFEQPEANPMLGFRGASRYYNPRYREGFRLECEAVRIVRDEMGLTNIRVMIPFCRTVEEGKKVLKTMEEFGLARGKNGLEVYMMVEIPSNVVRAREFASIFDGFSIGSNDLTQLTLGIDRDSSLIAGLFNEQDPAVMELISEVIQSARKSGIPIGLCGQGPSDKPEFARFLVEQGIDSISFNPDALLKGIENINKAEQKQLAASKAIVIPT